MSINIKEMFRGVDKKWMKVFTSESVLPLLSNAIDVLKARYRGNLDKITPNPGDIFNFARATKYGELKVVILGQDPYPKKGDAHGLAFSSLSTKIPSSLKNIYNCLNKSVFASEVKFNTSNLTHWAKQGVLLLNCALTTEIGIPNAHAAIWKPFTNELIRYISSDANACRSESLIFLLWGNYAKKKVSMIDGDCITLEWIHPSPLAQATATEETKFINCDHFTESNNFLEQMSITPIDWDPIARYEVYTDGACSNNGKGIFSSAGYSSYFAEGSFGMRGVVMYGKVPPVVVNGKMVYGTNQRSEGIGIMNALSKIWDIYSTDSKMTSPCQISIITDSEFWKNMIEEYMPNWERKGIDFKTKKNHDITEKLHEYVKNLGTFCDITIYHVNSHEKNADSIPEHVAGNKIADTYAVKGKSLSDYNVVEEII